MVQSIGQIIAPIKYMNEPKLSAEDFEQKEEEYHIGIDLVDSNTKSINSFISASHYSQNIIRLTGSELR